MSRKVLSGFSLIELLIVIGIIGLLLQLILPAVQASREAARRTQCSNNLRQISFAFQNHHDTFEHFPSSGWGWRWTGHPDRGFGKKQPGGWAYNILPFIEQQQIRDLGSGLPDGSIEQKEAILQANATPISLLYCPSRRFAQTYPLKVGNVVNGVTFSPLLPDRCTSGNGTPCKVARLDYAVNTGNFKYHVSSNSRLGPDSLESAEFWEWPDEREENADKHLNGISFQRSEVRLAQITDGSSNTYCVGEKFMDIRAYESGDWAGDNESAFVGHNSDTNRFTAKDSSNLLPPTQDSLDGSRRPGFGSVHSSGLNMTFCDSSVRLVSYDIDPEVHRLRGGRDDEVSTSE
ncbi:MAG: DUF1559 domain-containing protein [Pirellulales bacterium]|nr:DUF1559 domain-containing protein [Pirellulales bacterium]